jgi:hypothetical protein
MLITLHIEGGTGKLVQVLVRIMLRTLTAARRTGTFWEGRWRVAVSRAWPLVFVAVLPLFR